MRMVHPFAGKEANMVLIDAVKGAKSYVHVETSADHLPGSGRVYGGIESAVWLNAEFFIWSRRRSGIWKI